MGRLEGENEHLKQIIDNLKTEVQNMRDNIHKLREAN